jgi:hypothetical protein
MATFVQKRNMSIQSFNTDGAGLHRFRKRILHQLGGRGGQYTGLCEVVLIG